MWAFLCFLAHENQFVVRFDARQTLDFKSIRVDLRHIILIAFFVILIEDHRIEQQSSAAIQKKTSAIAEEFLEQEIRHVRILKDVDDDQVVFFFGFQNEFKRVVDHDFEVWNLIQFKIIVRDFDDFLIDLDACDLAAAFDFIDERLDHAAAGDAQHEDVLHRGNLIKADRLESFAQDALQAAVRIIGVLRVEYELAVVPGNFQILAQRRFFAVDVDRNQKTEQALEHFTFFPKISEFLILAQNISEMKQALYRFIFFRLMGWSIRGAFDPKIGKCVIMVLPHTSWHDFYIGLLARGIINLEMHYVAKKELFRFPFGAYFRWMGGAPLDRSGGKNKVDSIVEIFNSRKIFRLAIAPEGTRQHVDELKTGFYYIALKANVPIVPVAFDFGKKQVNVGDYFYPTGNLKSDLPILLSHFIGVRGKFPQNGFDVEKFLQSAKP